MRLLNSEELESSSTVANRNMNRERRLTGSNGYVRELGLDIVKWLCGFSGRTCWADLCCGTGRAVIEAAGIMQLSGEIERFAFEGIDLAGLFDSNPLPHMVALREAAIETWEPAGSYALVTCVHGLHYVGNKINVIAKAVASLSPEGLFMANLDLSNFRYPDGRVAGRLVASHLREAGIIYDARRRLVRCRGPRRLSTGLRYLGADDNAGPNYTGQPAVNSYYDV